MKVKSESEVTQPCLTPSDPMDFSVPGSSSMGFSRQEYWSGVPLPSLALDIVRFFICHRVNEKCFFLAALICISLINKEASTMENSMEVP